MPLQARKSPSPCPSLIFRFAKTEGGELRQAIDGEGRVGEGDGGEAEEDIRVVVGGGAVAGQVPTVEATVDE